MRRNGHTVGYQIDSETGCWIWQGSTRGGGYGRVRRRGRDGGTQSAHRWFYEELVGPIPEGLDLDHLCRNRRCVNPSHLEPVTEAENCRRGAKAVITANDAREIRRLYDERTMLQREIAAHFGISEATVRMIGKRKRWADV